MFKRKSSAKSPGSSSSKKKGQSSSSKAPPPRSPSPPEHEPEEPSSPPNLQTYYIDHNNQQLEFWPRYQKLYQKKVKPTKFFCKDTVTRLGIKEEVLHLCKTAGWAHFIKLNAPTYTPLTYEFLSSLWVEDQRPDDGPSFEVLHFKMFNQWRAMTLHELNLVFGWDVDAPLEHPEPFHFIDNGYDEDAWWRSITTNETRFSSRTSKPSSVIHPALRYFTRLMVYALFSRKDLSQINKQELLLWWVAAQREPIPGKGINYGSLLLQRFLDLQSSKPSASEMQIGGMITLIALKLGLGEDIARFKLKPVKDRQSQPEGAEYLDLAVLDQQLFISKPSSMQVFTWLVRGLPYCALPSKQLTKVNFNRPHPWKFPSQFQQSAPSVQQPAPEGPLPSQAGGGESSSSSFDMNSLMGAITNLQTTSDERHAQYLTHFDTILQRQNDFSTRVEHLTGRVDDIARVVWRNHLGNVNHSYAPPTPITPNFHPPMILHRGIIPTFTHPIITLRPRTEVTIWMSKGRP